MSRSLIFVMILFVLLVLAACTTGNQSPENEAGPVSQMDSVNGEAKTNESEAVALLRDSIAALKQAALDAAKENEEEISAEESFSNESRFVFCEIEYRYYSYEYLPSERIQRATPVSIDGKGQIHTGPREEDIVLKERWGNKQLVSKTIFCEVSEIKNYNEDAHYRFLDKIESRLRATSNYVSQDRYYNSPKPSSEFKVIRRKLHVFESYAEASKALELLK